MPTTRKKTRTKTRTKPTKSTERDRRSGPGARALVALLLTSATAFAQNHDPPLPAGPGSHPPGPTGPDPAPKIPDPSRRGGPRRIPPFEAARNLTVASGPNVVFAAPLDADLLAAPCVTPAGVVAGTASGAVSLIEFAHGDVVWTAHVGSAVTAGPVASGDAAVVATAAGQLLSISLRDGTIRDRATIAGRATAPLAADAGHVAVSVGTSELRVYRTAGLVLDTTLPGLGQISAAPSFVAGRLVVGSSQGDVASVDVAKSAAAPAWRTRLDSAITGRPIALPGVASLVLLGTRSGSLATFDPETGKPGWTAHHPAAFVGAAVSGERLFAVFADNAVVELDPATGAEKHRALMQSPPAVAPVATAQRLFVVGADGAVDGLDLDLLRRSRVELRAAPIAADPAGATDVFVSVKPGVVYRIAR